VALAELNHLAVCVHLEQGRYLADVGLGDYAHVRPPSGALFNGQAEKLLEPTLVYT
jgi:arylamine N-acetyltransferase